MFVVLQQRSLQSKIRIDERDLWQRRRPCDSRGLRQKSCHWQKVWIVRKKSRRLRRIQEIVGPRYAVLVEQIEDSSCIRLVTARRRKDIVRRQVAKRGRGHQVRTVGKSRPKQRRKIAVADGEFLRQIVIKGKIALIVIAHGRAVRRTLHAVVDLFRQVVDAYESVRQKARQRAVRAKKISLVVRAEPRVVQVRSH